MTSPCFWCSGMRWLGPAGRWFENKFWQCCKQHDLDYIKNSQRRAQGRPELKPRAIIDAEFYDCMAAHGFWAKPLAMVSYGAVRALYWPSRWIKYLIGKSTHI